MQLFIFWAEKRACLQVVKYERDKGAHRMAHSPQALTTHQGRKQVKLVSHWSQCQRLKHSMPGCALDRQRPQAAPGHLEPLAAIFFSVCSLTLLRILSVKVKFTDKIRLQRENRLLSE